MQVIWVAVKNMGNICENLKKYFINEYFILLKRQSGAILNKYFVQKRRGYYE